MPELLCRGFGKRSAALSNSTNRPYRKQGFSSGQPRFISMCLIYTKLIAEFL